MFKFFHLICGTSIFGLLIAQFFYIARSIQKADLALIKYSVKISYFGDAAIFLCLLTQLMTANKLVFTTHLSLDVPWIRVAYHAFGAIVGLWGMNLGIKFFYMSKHDALPSNIILKFFYGINIFIIMIFIIIIHDAVTKNTWFDFLLRK